MVIYNQLKKDIISALKSKSKEVLPCLRTFDAAILKVAKDGNKDITDEMVIQIAKKSVKEKEVSKSFAVKAGRDDLIKKAVYEIGVVSKYIPDTLPLEETEKAILKAIEVTGATSKKDMGKVMGYLKSEYGGRLDMSLTSQIVGKKL